MHIPTLENPHDLMGGGETKGVLGSMGTESTVGVIAISSVAGWTHLVDQLLTVTMAIMGIGTAMDTAATYMGRDIAHWESTQHDGAPIAVTRSTVAARTTCATEGPSD